MRAPILDIEKLKAIKAQANTLTTENRYAKILLSKEGWTPAEGDTSSISDKSGIAETLKRCMALALALELPVGHLIGDALVDLGELELNLNDVEAALLADNALDELTHFKGFSAYADWSKTYHNEANSITDYFMGVKANPVFTAGYIELGLFFVVLAILRKFGNSAIKLLSGYVSRDEAAHVKTNWFLIDEHNLGQEYPSLANARLEVVEWLTQDLKVLGYKKDYWINQSDKLIATRQSDMEFTKPGQYTAFFEIPNTSLAAY